MKIKVFKVSQSSPDDLLGLERLVREGKLNLSQIVAILGKTEGNGCVNDFTRGFTTQTLKHYLQAKVSPEFAKSVIYVMSGGTEGVLSPHLTIFTREETQPTDNLHWGLVLGTSRTRDFLPEEIGTLTMVQVVAESVRQAMNSAGLEPQNVHFVQIKCPLIAASRTGSQQNLKTHNSYQSMAYSRGASALGVAVALGEIPLERIAESDICANYSLYSSVASTSAGVELQNCEIIVLGNSPQSASDYVIHHSVMQHALDTTAIQQAIQGTQQPITQIVNIFAKAEADPAGSILNRRHTMLDDSDINHTRMARAVVGAVVASVVQDPMVYVSGGSEHQGPPGGGPVAAIALILAAQ
ncbi:ring-opening amidohydrolase [Geitlerinema splendidum]|nr:ring-opening amidohydrolase [Geitlerinema splendidum]